LFALIAGFAGFTNTDSCLLLAGQINPGWSNKETVGSLVESRLEERINGRLGFSIQEPVQDYLRASSLLAGI